MFILIDLDATRCLWFELQWPLLISSKMVGDWMTIMLNYVKVKFFLVFCWFFFGGGKDNMDEVVVNVINIVMNSIWANMKVIFSSKNLPFNFNSQLCTMMKWSQLGTLKHQNQWKYHESKLQYLVFNVLHYIMHVIV